MERAGPWLAIPWDPAVIYHVFANRKNIGDWLCARAMQSLLDQPVVELMCDEPFVADTLARLSAAGPEDLVLIGGGGLLMDYFQPFWVGFEPLSRRLPFCLWGVGCCDMKRVDSAVDADLITRIVRRSRLCVVRDQLTRENCGACVLGGYRPRDDWGDPELDTDAAGPNYAGWARIYVEARRVIPKRWEAAFLAQLHTPDNLRYAEAVARSVVTFGYRFA